MAFEDKKENPTLPLNPPTCSPQNNTEKKSWAIIGGGILGMTLAHRLAQHGASVTLYEAAPHLGGLADAWQLADIVWDRYYHVILLSDTRLRALLKEIGLEDELTWKETRTGFYSEGQLYSMSNSMEFLRFPPLGLIDKLRLGATIFYASRIKNWQKLETIPVANWLRRWSGKNTFEKIWLPLLRAKLGEHYKSTSAAFIWATIARMYAARRTGLKKEMFGYVSGGYARILTRFEQVLREEGVTIKTGHAAQEITNKDDSFTITFDDSRQEQHDEIILTVPEPTAAQLCSDLTNEEKFSRKNIKYLGIICASVLLKKPVAGYYVTNITDSWVPFTAVIEMSALVEPHHLSGNTLIYLPKYVDPDEPIFKESDEVIERTFLEALFKMYPHLTADDVLSFQVSRTKNVFALSTINYSTKLPSMTTSIPGLHIISSAHIVNGTLNVNQTIKLAESALSKLLP